jgi:hypothetical protein
VNCLGAAPHFQNHASGVLVDLMVDGAKLQRGQHAARRIREVLPFLAAMRYKVRMKTTPITLLVLLACALPAQAEVYKCRQPDGRTEISNSPCSGGSSTVKAIPDDTVSEASRQQAERNADRLEDYTDQLEAKRKAGEAAERKQLKEQQASAPQGPSPASVQACLQTLERMALDLSRRAELEDGCRTSGSVQPVYVQDPYYYGGSGYIRPPYPPHPPRPLPTPLPAPITPAKPVDLYKVPGAPRNR